MKTIIKIFLSFVIAISPIFLINSANAAVGGWTLGNSVAVGASTVYEGTKQVIIDGKNYIKTGTAKITPVASQVSKVLARGVAGAALSVAVEQLLGSVDWVLDPANNQIVYYKDPTDPTNCQTDSCKGEYIWYLNTTLTNNVRVYYSAPSESIAISLFKASVLANGSYSSADVTITGTTSQPDRVVYSHKTVLTRASDNAKSNVTGNLAFYRVLNPNADPEAEERERKTLPLETVAQQVISNAESGDTNAQVATTAAAADIVAEAETDNTKARPIVDQLNGSSSTKPADSDAAANAGTGTATATPRSDPVTGEQAPPTDIALEFPVFCNWAPTVCEAAQTVISFPTTLADWWNTGKTKAEEWALSISEAWISFRDWFKSDDDLPDDERPQISEIPTPELKEDAIRWSAQCPADAQVPISMQGVSSTITFSWSPWCQLLDMIKPAIIVSAYIGAAFIVLGLRT